MKLYFYLVKKLYEGGIIDFWANIDKTNDVSIKLIERCGGVVIGLNNKKLLYECKMICRNRNYKGYKYFNKVNGLIKLMFCSINFFNV